jgi:hypothetical protein
MACDAGVVGSQLRRRAHSHGADSGLAGSCPRFRPARPHGPETLCSLQDGRGRGEAPHFGAGTTRRAERFAPAGVTSGSSSMAQGALAPGAPLGLAGDPPAALPAGSDF